MNIKKTRLLAFILLGIIISGCSMNRYEVPDDVDLIPVSHKAAQELLNKSKKTLPKNSLVVVSSFVNVDELKQTSSFGRIVASQIATAFFNSGYQIKSIELPTEFFVQSIDGFVQLSPETRAALEKQGASALIVGVFAPARNTAYVTARMIDVDSKKIISSTDFAVPMGMDARVLLKSRKAGSSMVDQ